MPTYSGPTYSGAYAASHEGRFAHSSVGTGAPVDLVHLARQTMGDETLEREILRLFKAQSVLLLDRLKQASAAVAWREAAHTLKGSARGIGAWSLAQKAEDCEGADFGQAAVILSELDAEVSRTNEFVAQLVAPNA